eukprot:1152402-Pelagomonas_calceolata.AAC.2
MILSSLKGQPWKQQSCCACFLHSRHSNPFANEAKEAGQSQKSGKIRIGQIQKRTVKELFQGPLVHHKLPKTRKSHTEIARELNRYTTVCLNRQNSSNGLGQRQKCEQDRNTQARIFRIIVKLESKYAMVGWSYGLSTNNMLLQRISERGQNVHTEKRTKRDKQSLVQKSWVWDLQGSGQLTQGSRLAALKYKSLKLSITVRGATSDQT